MDTPRQPRLTPLLLALAGCLLLGGLSLVLRFRRAKGGGRRQLLRLVVAVVPLPVLGIPGWWPANEDPDFYVDNRVFRPASPLKSAARP